MSPAEFPAGSVAPWGPARSEEPIGSPCPGCGEINSESARFCQQCAEPLGGLPRVEPTSQVVGTVAAVVCGAFGDDDIERAQEVLDLSGGVLQELPESPNVIAAVFGPEPVGGDVPLRAVRAAADIVNAISQETAGADGGGPPPVRVGVGTCEVMEGDAEERTTGRVVGLAVRLERMAAPGEVILSEDVRRLVGNVVSVEPVDPRVELDANGSTGPLRLLGIGPPASGTPALSSVPLIGREQEREELREILDRAVAQRSGRLVGIVGEAGVGKTALVEESLRELEARSQARVLRVRCQPTQELGATWPLAEILEQAAGIDRGDTVEEARRKIEGVFEDAGDATAIEWMAGVIALPGANAVADETPRALSRVFSAIARSEPLVLWVDDADRVDPTFWHLLRRVAAGMQEVPLVVLSASRELPAAVEESGDLDVARLEPLAEKELGLLAEGLLGGGELDEGVQRLVVDTSEGNPFVAEHMLAMLVEEGLVQWEGGLFVPAVDLSAPPTPPGAEAVLRARLDWLSPEEQIVAGLAATVGETFPLDLVAELLPEEDRSTLTEHLEALVEKHLIRPEPARGAGESMSFRHSLVREAAARYVRDEARAEVHEHCAMWLEHAAGDRAPRYSEVIASHLVSAFEIQTRFGHADPDTRELGDRAAALLAEAASRAGQVGDERGASLLFDRASSLLPHTEPGRSDLLLRSALALATLGDHRVNAVLAEVASSARASGARGAEWRAKVLSARLGLSAAFSLDALERAHSMVDEAIEAFEELGDETGLSSAWSLRGSVYLRWGNLARFAEAAERAAEHARRAGMAREEIECLRDLVWATLIGPLPVAEAIRRCEAIRERVQAASPAEQDAEGVLAVLQARRGRFEEARRLTSRALAALEDLGLEEETAVCLHRSGLVEALAGEHDAAERAFRRALGLTQRTGREQIRARAAASLAHVTGERGNPEEALELTALSERTAASEDFPTQVGWRTARAKALARLGRFAEAEALARIAVRLAEQTDALPTRGEALLDLAQVRGLVGRASEALSLAARALWGFDRRGAVAQAEAARGLIERLGAPGPMGGQRPTAGDPVDLPQAPAEPGPGGSPRSLQDDQGAADG